MLAKTEEFFFLGARAGWAGGNSGSPIERMAGLPGIGKWREAVYEGSLDFEGYHFADRWGEDPESGNPSGSMFITHWNIPVWGMWIGGDSYNKDVFDFLQKALMENYQQSEFCGGRGPSVYQEGNLRYVNVWEGDFTHFEGYERIEYIGEDGKAQLAGSHEYWGGSFVFIPRA